jgi:hypothetical protein
MTKEEETGYVVASRFSVDEYMNPIALGFC